MPHATDNIPPHTLFKWRVSGDSVAGDGLPASQSMRRRLVLLPVRRALSSDIRGRGGDRLKPLQPLLSLLHVKVQESPPVLILFHCGPCNFNFVYGPDFCYINFDLIRLVLQLKLIECAIFTSLLLLLISRLGLIDFNPFIFDFPFGLYIFF